MLAPTPPQSSPVIGGAVAKDEGVEGQSENSTPIPLSS